MPPVTNPAYPYDITLTTNGVTYGFLLVTPPQQSKQLDISEVPTPTGIFELRRISTPETLTHTDFDLKEDMPWSQDTFAGGAGQLTFNSKTDEINYWWSSGIVTHTDGLAYLAKAPSTLTLTSGANTYAGRCSFLTSGGTRYDFCIQGPRIYRRDATLAANAWSVVYTADVNITDIQIINGKMFICVPTHLDATSPANTDYYYQSDPTAAATWTPTGVTSATGMSDALGKPSFFLQVRGTTYAFVQNQRVLYSVDATVAGDWVGPINTSLKINGANQVSGPPGDTTYPFLNVIAMNNYLFAFKQDAAYTIDANQEVREAIWEWKENVATRNFKFSCTADSVIYYSMAPEIYAYDPVTGRNLSIGLAEQAGFSIQDILGLDGNDSNLYVLAKVLVPNIRSAATTALFRVFRTGAMKWMWEIIWEDQASTAYQGLATVPNGTGTNIYIFNSAGTSSTLIYIPPDYDETTQGNFTSTADIYLSIWRTGFPNFIKRWGWIAAEVYSLSSTNTFNIAYSTDLGVTFTSLTTLIASGLTFTDMTGINSESIVLRFRFVSANGTVSPVLRVFDLHGRARFRYLRQVKAAVRVADYIENLASTRDGDTAPTIKANIETIRASNANITYKDFLGNSFLVGVDAVGYKPTRQEQPDSNYEMEAQMQLSEMGSGT